MTAQRILSHTLVTTARKIGMGLQLTGMAPHPDANGRRS